MTSKFTLGADPEMFLTDGVGALVSAIHKVGGSKTHPRPLMIGDGFAVQEDNVAVEYNIPPAKSPEELLNNIKAAKDCILHMVQQQGLTFSPLSAAEFPDDQLKDPAALVFGCDPDYNAWTGKRNPRPRSSNKNLRSCGGHVHVGYKFQTRDDVRKLMCYLDLYLGVPSVLMDTGEQRKQLYGKHGAFRYKPFGGEYRVLSNFWTFEDKYMSWVWESVDNAINSFEKDSVDLDSVRGSIIDAIDNNNKNTAMSLVEHHNLLLV